MNAGTLMGEVSFRGFVVLALTSLLLVPGTVSADPGPDPVPPVEGVPEAVERTLYGAFELGEEIGDARCADVSLMNQDAPMTVQPYVAPEYVGVELGGAPEPVSSTVVVMAYPVSCIEYVLGVIAPEGQDVDRLLP